MNSPLIEIMEEAYQASNESHSQANKNVSQAIQHHFRNHKDIKTILSELRAHDFIIIENRFNGWRIWPDGEVNQYPKEISIRIPNGNINYYAKNKYHLGILERKTAVIKIETDGEKVTSIKALINIDTL